jgi:hypothetical protein
MIISHPKHKIILMAEERSPLLLYLKTPNPKVDSTWSLQDGRSGSKSRGRSSPHYLLLFKDVLEWKDLEWKSLLKPMFDRILRLPVSNMPRFEDFLNYPNHLSEVSDENSLDALLVRWTYPVVSTALSAAQSHPNFRDTISASDHQYKISMARGGQAWLPQENKLTPDWAGILLSFPGNNCTDDSQPGKLHNKRAYKNVLPGDTKLSTKFKSEWGPEDQRFQDPVNQVFTYCRRANVPYGYIITQEELVVLRLFDGDKNNPDRQTGRESRTYVEWKAVSWANNTNDELTVNLTLWCLHMLAARDRTIGGRKQLISEYPTPERSTRSDRAESTSPSTNASSDSSEDDKIEHSFYKRKRSEETGSERSGGTVKKRRSERVQRTKK